MYLKINAILTGNKNNGGKITIQGDISVLYISGRVNGINIDGALEGGTLVQKREDFPYQVSLRLSKKHFCGGALIRANYVLTTAKCAEVSTEHSVLQIIAGDLNINNHDLGIQTRYAKQIYIHEDYSKMSWYDIAIIELEANFDLNSRVQTIDIFKRSLSSMKTGIVSGWGVTFWDAISSSKLNCIEIPLVDVMHCLDVYGTLFRYDMMICAGYFDNMKDACAGDTGGPMVQDNELVGLLAHSQSCSRSYFPEIFIHVNYFSWWIDNKIGLKNDDRNSANTLTLPEFIISVIISSSIIKINH